MQDISRDVAESEKLRNVDFFVVIIMSHGKYGTYGYRTYEHLKTQTWISLNYHPTQM